MTQALTRRDAPISLPQVYEGLGMMPPAVKVAIAADWAKELMAVVEAKRLFQLISGKKFLQAEAWELIGSFDECTAETRYESIVEDGEIVGYKGIAVLMRRGERVGGGEGACYMDAAVTRGKQGRSRDRAAQSAAQTWAAAKALRIKYSYVAVLGGYEPTPAEEMADTSGAPAPRQATPAARPAPTPPAADNQAASLQRAEAFLRSAADRNTLADRLTIVVEQKGWTAASAEKIRAIYAECEQALPTTKPEVMGADAMDQDEQQEMGL